MTAQNSLAADGRRDILRILESTCAAGVELACKDLVAKTDESDVDVLVARRDQELVAANLSRVSGGAAVVICDHAMVRSCHVLSWLPHENSYLHRVVDLVPDGWFWVGHRILPANSAAEFRAEGGVGLKPEYRWLLALFLERLARTPQIKTQLATPTGVRFRTILAWRGVRGPARLILACLIGLLGDRIHMVRLVVRVFAAGSALALGMADPRMPRMNFTCPCWTTVGSQVLPRRYPAGLAPPSVFDDLSHREHAVIMPTD